MNKETNPITIIVTGCGGDIGLGAGRILKMAGIAQRIVGCDLTPDHAGSAVFDVCELLPPASDPTYLLRLGELVNKVSAQWILPTSEHELRFLTKSCSKRIIEGARLLMANPEALTTGFDKLATARFLEDAGLPFPWTQSVSEGAPREFPCIIKKRFGSGGRDVALVNEELAPHYQRGRADDIWQEYLRPDDQEYTCGVFRSRSGETRSVVFRRTLLEGVTSKGQVVSDPEIESLLRKMADRLNLRGCINVQLRLTERGPVVFEINPRLSSTLVFRHLLGFSDLLWMIADDQGMPVPPYTPPTTGTRFYRTSHEVFVSP